MEKSVKNVGNNRAIFSEINQLSIDPRLMEERAMQVENVLRVLRETANKIRISLILPHFLENPFLLRNYITDPIKAEHAMGLMNICLKKWATHLKDVKCEKDVDPFLNHDSIRLIDFFHENYQLINVPEKWIENLTEEDKMLIQAMDTLIYISEEHLKKSAVEELKREQEIHQLHHENETLLLEIEAMEEKAKQQNATFNWKTSSRQSSIKRYEEDLAYKKWDNSVRIKKEIERSTHRIRNIHNATLAKQKELEEELEQTRAVYENTLKKNLEMEKETRAEKNKLLLQLQLLLNKFDSVIGDKMKESMRLSDEYEEEKKIFDEFMKEFAREEEQYNLIVRERESEEKRIFEQNLALFIMNRAAKIIQRAFRRFWKEQKKQNKKNKKGGKKGKKK